MNTTLWLLWRGNSLLFFLVFLVTREFPLFFLALFSCFLLIKNQSQAPYREMNMWNTFNGTTSKPLRNVLKSNKICPELNQTSGAHILSNSQIHASSKSAFYTRELQNILRNAFFSKSNFATFTTAIRKNTFLRREASKTRERRRWSRLESATFNNSREFFFSQS